MSRPATSRTAAAILAQIEAWCARTRTPETYVGHLLFRHPGFVALLRKRGTLSIEKRDAVLAMMKRKPNGIRRSELPSMFLKTPSILPAITEGKPQPSPKAVQCGVCGHRVEDACKYGGCPLREAA